MKFFNILFVSALALNGCAVYTINLPVADSSERVQPIKDTAIERIRAGNVLFVNRSPVWREVAVFDGYFSEDRLIGIGPDGLPMLMAIPIGRFEIGPSEDYCDEDTDLNRKLVKFLWPGQEYTLLVLSKNGLGGLVAPLQVSHGSVTTRSMSERYYYREWLGPRAGQTVFVVVNDVEFLPNVSINEHRGTNYLFDKQIDVNQLLQRGIRRLQGQN